MKSKIITILKTSVTLLLFYFLFRKIDFAHFGETLRNARPDILLVGFLIMWLAHYICIYRWRILMRPLMPVFSILHLFKIYCIGLFFNLTFPTAVGGDLVKMYYAGKPSKLYAQSFAATFLDRDSGMLAMMTIACAGTLFIPMEIPGVPLRPIIYLSFLLFIFANIAIFTPSLHRLVTRLLLGLKLARTAARIDAVSSAFQIMADHWGALAGSFAISLANQTLVISVSWVISKGLRLAIPYSYFLVFVPVITLISMIPISLNGMGLREYAFMSLFGSIGVAPASCVAMGVLASLLIFLSGVPGGIVYIFFRNRSDLQQMAALETDFS